MKKLILTFSLAALSLVGFAQSQRVAYFIKSTAPLNGNETASDTAYIPQGAIIRVDESTDGGSTISYIQGGAKSSVDVKEQVGDSAWTFATFTSTATVNDTLDSITIGGTNVTPNGVDAEATLGLTWLAIRDSISANSATDTLIVDTSGITSVSLTFRKIADSTATPNGTAIVIVYQGTVSPTSGVLSGGFYRRNISNIYGNPGSGNQRLFSVTEVGNSNDLLINSERISALDGDGPTTIWYDGARNRNIEVSDNRNTIQTAVNAQ